MRAVKYLFPLLLWSLSAHAGKFDACYEKARSTADMLRCEDQAYRYYDGKLNRAYKKIRTAFSNDPKETQYLKEAQRAWIVYRDKKCQFEGYPMRGGSGESPIIYGCKVRETKRRAVELEEIVNELSTMEME